ncbi:MAG: fumarate hydratase [Clostridia bacterium]|jgi:fumarate hydratase subunit alpha|nr:fumarate hydratase [Clostridiaceae bacterium]
MRVIQDTVVIAAVEKMCIEANCHLCEDVKSAIEKGRKEETSPIGQYILDQLIENAEIADSCNMPICQDTGMAVFFVEVGNKVLIEGRNLTEAINEGVRRGYTQGFLRKSVVADPFFRENTKDNTPAVIHYEFTEGDRLKITFAPKGFGSENMSRLKMLNPSDGMEGVKEFVIDTVLKAGPNPCPPIVVGVGIGGTMEMAALLAKKALTKPIHEKNPVEYLDRMENEILEKINETGIGPGGLGGKTTALCVRILVYPTHIAGLPVAVNINCHAARHAEVVI